MSSPADTIRKNVREWIGSGVRREQALAALTELEQQLAVRRSYSTTESGAAYTQELEARAGAAAARVTELEQQLADALQREEATLAAYQAEIKAGEAAEADRDALRESLDETAGYAVRLEADRDRLADTLREIANLDTRDDEAALDLARAALDRHTKGET